MASDCPSPTIDTVHDPHDSVSASSPGLDESGDGNVDRMSLTGAGDTRIKPDAATIQNRGINGSQDMSSKRKLQSTDLGAPALDAVPEQLAAQETDPSRLAHPVMASSHGDIPGNTDTHTHPGDSSGPTSPSSRGPNQEQPMRKPPSPVNMASPTNGTSPTAKSNRSGSSSGSSTTITQTSFSKPRGAEGHREKASQNANHESREGLQGRSPKHQQRPDVMTFLEPDSPPAFRVFVAGAGHQHSHFLPRSWKLGDVPPHRQAAPATSTSSSATSRINTDAFSDPNVYPATEATSPGHGIDGGSPQSADPAWRHGSRHVSPSHHRTPQDHGGQVNPEVPRESTRLPHGSPRVFPTRKPVPYGDHTMHSPVGEKLPMSGYELLATKLSAGNVRVGSGSVLKPMYRRFETLNHRLLLHLQDELAELEEQLRRIDAAGTQARRVQNYIFPASRRQETAELQWHRTDTLGKIGFKLNQYNSVLSSFKDTQGLPPPHPDDVHAYRTYLATHGPIVEPEARFLDWEDDLVSLARHPGDATAATTPNGISDNMPTPMPRKSVRFPSVPGSPTLDDGEAESSRKTRHSQSDAQIFDSLTASVFFLLRFFAAVSVAILIPFLCFVIIPSFVGRLVVVVFVCFSIFFAAALQGGFTRAGLRGPGRDYGMGEPQDWTVYLGVYGIVMAVVAMFF